MHPSHLNYPATYYSFIELATLGKNTKAYEGSG